MDQGIVGLDDVLSHWMPELPDSDKVILRMLANNTAGYPDYVQNATLLLDLNEHPFRQWTNQEIIDIGLSTPRFFAPGTNWDYSYTSFMILGDALAKIGGKPLDVLMQEQVLDPMGLRNTVNSFTPATPEPALHAFSSERRQHLGIAPGTRFYEECSYWNPSWTVAEGMVQTTDIFDVATSMAAVGEGTILSPAWRQAQISPHMLGFGTPIAGCAGCRTLTEEYNYGLAVVLHGKRQLHARLAGHLRGHRRLPRPGGDAIERVATTRAGAHSARQPRTLMTQFPGDLPPPFGVVLRFPGFPLLPLPNGKAPPVTAGLHCIVCLSCIQ